MSVLALLLIVLMSASNQAANLWSANERKSQIRERARTALAFIEGELRQAALPLDRSDQKGPQFVMNPAALPTALLNRDTLFWQAPIASSERASSDLAAIGYFIRRDGNTFNLCRFFVEPSDPDYQLYSASDWITGVIDDVAPATADKLYKGLLLKNTPGLWIKAYHLIEKDGATIETTYTPDSRANGKLPSRVEISLAFLDDNGAARIGPVISGDDLLGLIRAAADAEEFIKNLPPALRASAGSAKISVSFNRYTLP